MFTQKGRIKSLKEINCKECQKKFKQLSPGQIYCGSIQKKQGCSWLNDREKTIETIEKHKLRQRRYYWKKRISNWKERSKYAQKRTKDIIKERYTDYKLGAKYRNIKWLISFEEFKNFWQNPCYYCGDKVKTIGLDKINNENGYTIKNIVSCCSKCNYMKGKLSQKEFINQCKKVAR